MTLGNDPCQQRPDRTIRPAGIVGVHWCAYASLHTNKCASGTLGPRRILLRRWQGRWAKWKVASLFSARDDLWLRFESWPTRTQLQSHKAGGALPLPLRGRHRRRQIPVARFEGAFAEGSSHQRAIDGQDSKRSHKSSRAEKSEATFHFANLPCQRAIGFFLARVCRKRIYSYGDRSE